MPHCALVKPCKPVSEGTEGNHAFPLSILASPLLYNYFTASSLPQPLTSPSPSSYSAVDLASYFPVNTEIMGTECLHTPRSYPPSAPGSGTLPASCYRGKAVHTFLRPSGLWPRVTVPLPLIFAHSLPLGEALPWLKLHILLLIPHPLLIFSAEPFSPPVASCAFCLSLLSNSTLLEMYTPCGQES